MNDIRDVLQEAARSVEVAPSDETVEADLQRGRAALARRRRGRAFRWGLAGIAAVLVSGTAIVADNLGHTPDATRSSAGPRTGGHASAAAHGTSVRLVAYHGDQLEGFVVDQVPQGWFLQGSNAFRLTIAPQGDTTSPDGFEGKLVVMLLSSSVPQKLPQGDPVEVSGNDGVVDHQWPAETLTYQDDAGHFVQIQAWQSALGWTDEQLVSFAEGVHVTSDAQAGVG
ncbi:MAG TPA: hypothetical protein VEM93_09250 [Actinomycetota bacterium]|nr:hypothetical protein [Actinomycetota bacterium]